MKRKFEGSVHLARCKKNSQYPAFSLLENSKMNFDPPVIHNRIAVAS